MALTTLIGLLAMSAASKQEPIQVQIETKICRVAESSLVLEGKKGLTSLSEKPGGPRVLILQDVDEAKLLKSKGLKILSSPVIRTLDAMKAELSTQLSNDTEEIWKTTYIPTVRKDALLDLDLKFSATFKNDAAKSWEFANKPLVHPGQPIAYLISKDKQAILYIIKAHIGDGSRPRS